MSTKHFCDGCEANLAMKRVPGEDGVSRVAVPIGQTGDGINRSMTIRIGGILADIDACPSCLGKALEMLSTIFKAPVDSLVAATNGRGQ